MKNKSILILGVSSFVGSNLAEFLKKDYKVFGTYFRNRIEIPGVLTFPCDVLKNEQVQKCLQVVKPDFTIYCVGLSNVFECQNDPNRAQQLNANGLYFITENCHKYNSTLIYISSAMVFSGTKESYGEIDIPDFTTILGRTKSAGEYFLETSYPDYLIFRCCQLYGRGIVFERKNFFQQLETKEEQYCDNTLRFGFLDVNYLGMVISLAIENNLRNLLLQLSSLDLLNRFQFANRFAKIFDFDPAVFKKNRMALPHMFEETQEMNQPLAFNLKTQNIQNYLNITLPTIEESLDFTYRRFNGRSF
jgi:dTDP-4-dehydrorhamnose reductase